MPRLPVPGSDNDQWGDILNEFLLVEHAPDGTLKTPAIPLNSKGQVGGVAELSGSGLVPTGQLGVNSASSSTYLRGDGTWSTPPTAGNATDSSPGLIQLSGDLGGTAISPTISSGAITDGKVSASANIAQSKIQNLTNDLAEKVNINGDTMTGSLSLPAHGLTVGASQLAVSSNGTAFGVGIGTSSPSSATANRTVLQIVDTVGNGSEVRIDTSTLFARVFNNNTEFGFGTDTNHGLRFFVNGGGNTALTISPNKVSTFSGQAIINTAASASDSQLTITPSSSVSGASLLRFNTDRAWHFRQHATGAGTALELALLSSDKYFRIKMNDGAYNAFSILASSTSANNAIGVGVDPTGGAGRLQFAAGTTAADGIVFGSDTNLYRSSSDTLKTDDKFAAEGGLKITNSSTAGQVWRAIDGTGNGAWSNYGSSTQYNSNTSHTVSAGVTLVEIIAVGGGAGGCGGGASNGIANQSGGPGGASGAYTQKIVSTSPGEIINISIGAGGAGGTGGTALGGTGSNGGVGGTTTVTGTGFSVTARGGGIGATSTGNSSSTFTGGICGYPATFGSSPQPGGGGASTSSSGTTGGSSFGFTAYGGAGGGGSTAANSGSGGGGGGFSAPTGGTPGGAGATTGGNGGDGAANTGAGGGGGGGGANTHAGGNGGAGASGYVIIREIS